MKLDVCIIATVRPEVLKMTLQSFTKHLLNQFDCRVIINVDPAGDTENHTQMDVINLCREYFSEVIYRTPESASFAGAVKWVWQQVETELFFHLEDDWVLKRKIDKNEMVQLFDDTKVVNVSAGYHSKKNKFAKRIKHNTATGYFTPYSENTMQAPTFFLMPGFMRNKYYKAMADVMDLNKDPEFQYGRERNKLITADYSKPIFLVRTEPIIINSGRPWRRFKLMSKDESGGDIWARKRKRFFYKIEWAIKWQIHKRLWQMRYC